jgi:hypothetical protein
VEVLERTQRWVSWDLRGRLTSRLDTRHNPLGSWSAHVAKRRLRVSSGAHGANPSQLATLPPVPLPDVIAAFDALELYLACYDEPNTASVDCTMELAVVGTPPLCKRAL